MLWACVYRLVCFLALLQSGLAITCYVCDSFDGNNLPCEDLFLQDLSTAHFLVYRCTYTLFTATRCVKAKGITENGTFIMVRGCSDAEFGSLCGNIHLFYDGTDQILKGCLHTCSYDGCNSAPSLFSAGIVLKMMVVLLTTSAVSTG